VPDIRSVTGATLLLPFGVSAAVTTLVVPLVLLAARWAGLLDHPNERSSHRRVTPRGGGLAVAAGLAAALAVVNAFGGERVPAAVLAGAGLVAALGLADDRFRLPALPRLVGHVAAALLALGSTGGLARFPLPAPLDVGTGPLAIALGVLWIVAVLNFYNFMDGIDGLAAAQAVVTGIALAVALPGPAAPLGAAVAGGGAGFLIYNRPPARIFLGDVGSGLLGYTLAVAPFLAPSDVRGRAVLLTATSLALFLFDATSCLIRRAARGDRWYEAHREHAYQRWAARSGHAAVTGGLTALAVVATAAALLAFARPAWAWAGLAVAGAAFLVEWRLAASPAR
jgi:Fuc2NAc and GlcNAc transferase